MTGFESSGGRISGFIVWGIKYPTLDSLGGCVDFFQKIFLYKIRPIPNIDLKPDFHTDSVRYQIHDSPRKNVKLDRSTFSNIKDQMLKN